MTSNYTTSKADCFEEAENVLKITIPLFIKNMMKINGFDNEMTISQIKEEDITSIENFAKTTLFSIIDEHDVQNFYGVLFQKKPQEFCLLAGHRKIIFSLQEYFLRKNKRYNDVAVVTDFTVDPQFVSTCSNFLSDSRLGPSLHISEKNSQNVTKSNTKNLTEENSKIFHTISTWVKNKCNSEEWNYLQNQINNILIATELDPQNELTCSIVCLCKVMFKIPRLSRKITCQKRWIFSNFQKHFLKKHIEALRRKDDDTTDNQAISLLNTQNKITGYFSKYEKVNILQNIKLDSDPNICYQNEPGSSSPDNIVQETKQDISNQEHKLLLDDKNDTVKDRTEDGVSILPQSKWKSLKYQRSERSRRSRQKSVNSQSLITQYYSFIRDINNCFRETPDIEHDFNKKLEEVQLKDGTPLTTNKMLNILVTLSSNNSTSSNNTYDDTIKKFCLYMYYIGGKLLYETLHANLKNILPSPSTLYRYSLQNNRRLEEGHFDFEGLNKFLHERQLPKYVWFSEDSTRVIEKVQYDSSSNKLVGFVLPLRDGIPEKYTYLATSAKKIEEHFQNADKSPYIHVIMAQPLVDGAPAYCVGAFGTDNKFTHKDVGFRWNYLQRQATSYGINIVGFSSDGDSRLLKAMRISASLSCNIEINPKIFDWEWFNTHVGDAVYIQGQVHILTKLKTRLLKHNLKLQCGNYVISADYLHQLLENVTKDKHCLSLSDLKAEDKMNYDAARKICEFEVIEQLKNIPGSEATVIYLKCMRYLLLSFLDKNLDLETRVYYIWYTVFFFKIWKEWIKRDSRYTVKDNFLSSNCYTCIELNAHNLIKLILLFQKDEGLKPEMFCTWLFSSQTCQKIFRATRSLTSTYSTVVNFSIKDILHRIDRITAVNNVSYELGSTFVFPREEQKNKGFTNTSRKEGGMIIDTRSIITRALEDSANDAKSLGMDINGKEIFTLDYILPRILPTTCSGTDNIINNAENIFEEECNQLRETIEDDYIDENTIDFVQKNDIKCGEDIVNEVYREDSSEGEERNADELKLKDYSNKNMTLTEDCPFVRIDLQKNKYAVIKKSSYVWLLDDSNGRVSTDRLRRFFYNSKRNKDGVAPSVAKAKPLSKRKRGVKKNVQEESSESDNFEVLYEHTEDTETHSFSETSFTSEPPGEPDSPPVSVELGKYYAVSYDTKWYVGKILEKISQTPGECIYRMSFLKQRATDFIWPKTADIASVNTTFIFYGPIHLIGPGPFHIGESESDNINKLYENIRNM